MLRRLMTRLLGNTPRALRRAAEDGDLVTVRRLLDAGVSIDAITAQATPLFCAVCRDHADVVRELRQRGASLTLSLAADGTTVLHAAAQVANSDAVCDALLRPGDDVDAPSAVGVTPLMMACQFNRPAMVNALLARGADVDRAVTGSIAIAPAPGDAQGFTALCFALINGRDELVPTLLAGGARPGARLAVGFTELMLAATSSGPEAVRALVGAGAAVDEMVRGGPLDGMTALMVACAPPGNVRHATPLAAGLFVANRINVIETFIDLGADVDACGAGGKSARDIAHDSGLEKMVPTLAR